MTGTDRSTAGLALRIEAVRERVRRNEPHRHDPEAFHVEKSEITHELTKIARELGPAPRVTAPSPRRG